MTTHLSNYYLKPIKMKYLLTNHAIHLKIVLFYLTTHLTETLKLIIVSDTNQKRIMVFSYHLQYIETIIHYREQLKESW